MLLQKKAETDLLSRLRFLLQSRGVMKAYSSYLSGVLLSCLIGINAFGHGGHPAFMRSPLLRKNDVLSQDRANFFPLRHTAPPAVSNTVRNLHR
jgi:hypothetical protein